MAVELHPLDKQAPALESMTVRELIAELARLQDMVDRDAASNGYRPVPGQMRRRAELQRRERRIMRELDRRYAAEAPAADAPSADSPSTDSPSADAPRTPAG